MTPPAHRICSLLPSATEIVCALGLADYLVGITHECDYPAEAVGKPKVTTSVIQSDRLSSREIDQAVRENLAGLNTIYHLDRDQLDRLHPDLILTQDLCTVCAVGIDEVRDMATSLSGRPDVVSLEPTSLTGMLDSILLVGRLTGSLKAAVQIVGELRDRLEVVKSAVSGEKPVPVLTLEWLDPPFAGGHWVPEMITLAGGQELLGESGKPSRVIEWAEAVKAAPEVIIAMPCGYGLERSVTEVLEANLPDRLAGVPAIRHERVYAVDGSAYFNRPGPRLINGVEILANILHSGALPNAPEGTCRRVEVGGSPLAAARHIGADRDSKQK